MRIIVVLLLLLATGPEGLLTRRQKEAKVGLHYRTDGESTTLRLEPLGGWEANVVLVGVNSPHLSKKQKVEKFLTEGLAAKEDLLNDLEDAIMILTRGGVSYNPADIEPVMQEVERLRREVRLIKLVAAAIKKEHDEL
jgi:hypothetical protein